MLRRHQESILHWKIHASSRTQSDVLWQVLAPTLQRITMQICSTWDFPRLLPTSFRTPVNICRCPGVMRTYLLIRLWPLCPSAIISSWDRAMSHNWKANTFLFPFCIQPRAVAGGARWCPARLEHSLLLRKLLFARLVGLWVTFFSLSKIFCNVDIKFFEEISIF